MVETALVLLSHCHVPWGSTDEEFERAYADRARPFITALYRWPAVFAVVHYSGAFLEWLNARHPEFISLLEELVGRKQVEMLGGGYYEPAFTLIPQADRISQIELQTTLVRKLFGKRPRGCFLPESLWDPSLVGALNTCGIDYVFLGADQFRSAGLKGHVLETPVTTEDQGRVVTVLPTSDREELTSIFTHPSELVRGIQRSALDHGERVICFHPESFLPRDSSINSREKLLDGFFSFICEPHEGISLQTAQRVVRGSAESRCERQRVYFPNSAHALLMYWALDTEQRKHWDEGYRHTRREQRRMGEFSPTGAYPRQFLTRYEESANMYAKMNYVHLLVNQLRGDKSRKKTAREELLKSQGLGAFIHVESGGIYSNRLRKAVYRAQIMAEKITRQKGSFAPCLMVQDFRLDGFNDYLFLGNELNVYVKPKGGTIFELDHLPKQWNYLDTMARHGEPYLDATAVLDRVPRSGFMDFFLPPDYRFGDAPDADPSRGRVGASELYEELEVDRTKQLVALRLQARKKGPFAHVEMVKTYSLCKNVLTVKYSLLNTGDGVERFNFMPRTDLSLADEERAAIFSLQADGQRVPLSPRGEVFGAQTCILEDSAHDLAIALAADRPLDWWLYPLKTRCRLNGVVGEYYQSTSIAPLVPVVLAPGESWSTTFTLSFSKLESDKKRH